MAIRYTTLDNDTKAALARDALRARESDHFRVSLLNEPNKEERLAHLEAEIKEIKATLGSLEKKKEG